jgi:YD repeat-containing protein
LGHHASIGYGENFSDGNNGRNTFAYPTSVTDADNYASAIQYNFDLGAKTLVQNPLGATQRFTYDDAARVSRTTIQNTGAYTRYDLRSQLHGH